MNFTFIIPLIALIILFALLIILIRYLIKIRLITLFFMSVFPLTLGIWMINRVITALSIDYIDPFRISNICYTIGPLFLVLFLDLISKGRFTWKSICFSFYAGGLIISALFLDDYRVGYNHDSGLVIVNYTTSFYIFIHLYILIIVLILFGYYLYSAYLRNSGKEKKILKRISIVYFVSVLGTFIFSILRSFRLIDYPYINSIDALFLAIGFGYMAWNYLKTPYLFHLDMVDINLMALFVYDNNSGILLYSYEFKAKKFECKELISGFFKGIDSLFKEILASDQPLKEVRHGSNIVLFNQGSYVSIGLLTNHSTIVTNNWLYNFRVEFEKEFRRELDYYFETQALDFEDKPDSLVKKIFLHE